MTQSEQARTLIERIDAIRSDIRTMIENCNDEDAATALQEALDGFEVENAIQGLAGAARFLDEAEQAEDYRAYCGRYSTDDAQDLREHLQEPI